MAGKGAGQLRAFVQGIDRWHAATRQAGHNHIELAEQILDESGYTGMWQNDKTPEAPGRLENLKELVKALEGFENLQGFLEHVALIMDNSTEDAAEKVSIMTLHAAKGLEFDTVYLPGWEEGLFPHQRALDEQGRSGLEEERRLCYVGVTRARKRVKIYFATNRRIRGLWQTTIPSRFLDELPPDHVDVVEQASASYGGYAASRFNSVDTFGSSYSTPGWKRAQQRGEEAAGSQGAKSAAGASYGRSEPRRGPLTIEGEIVAKSSGGSAFKPGSRVFHMKFGNGKVASTEGNKLTVDFDKAGRKMVLDSFVQKQE